MYISLSQLLQLGISQSELAELVDNGKPNTNKQDEQIFLISSLPQHLQARLTIFNHLLTKDSHFGHLLIEAENYGLAKRETEIISLLSLLTPTERIAWINESIRLAKLIEHYFSIKPKRYKNPITKKLEFVDEVEKLCQEAICRELVILKRQPHRANLISPYTLDSWANLYKKEGLLAFLHNIAKISKQPHDRRKTQLSPLAQEWLSKNWRRFYGPRHLYKALKQEAISQDFSIPSESYFYRLWKQMPEIVKSVHQKGQQAYQSKYAVFVPRDYTDLQPLQVLCGDHSERDVTVLLPDNSIRRPWLTLWYDLRTGLIWGWHLDLVPSSVTAGLAYANGVENFGAQAPSKPEDNYFSYVYTDNGKDYRSHHWDGKVIAVHKEAMKPSSGLEFLCIERKIGILEDLNLRHILARPYNGKEKAVERVFKDISAWEKNTFAEYCGSKVSDRPKSWYQLYQKHQRFVNGKEKVSPFITLEQYREALARFITSYNSTPHQKSTLKSVKIIPLNEFRRLYTTRYEIRPETLVIILLKAEQRTIGKNGVQCFQKHWFYYHESMSFYKGQKVEIRYSDGDYSRIWVLLPKGELCQAELITPTSLLNPNKETLKVVAKARKYEQKLIEDYQLIEQSRVLGQTTEERVSQLDIRLQPAIALQNNDNEKISIYSMTRLEKRTMPRLVAVGEITAQHIAKVQANTSIFEIGEISKVNEED